MMIMIRESYRSGSGMQHTPEDSFPGTNKKAVESPRFDVAHLFTSPHENIPLLREVGASRCDWCDSSAQWAWESANAFKIQDRCVLKEHRIAA